MSHARVSVVVIGRNEGARLLDCLESVHRIDAPNIDIEVIYADSGSADGSPEAAEGAGARALRLGSTRGGASAARNAGWREARGEFVLFLDGDTIVHPAFLRLALAQFADPAVGMVGGHRRESATAASWYNRVLDLDWIGPCGNVEYVGGDALVRRAVLEETGGYDEALVAGEDPDFGRRVREHGHRVVRIDVPMTLHDLGIHTLKQYLRRAFRTGYAYAAVADRTRNARLPMWGDVLVHNRRTTLVHLALMAVFAITGMVFASVVPAAAYVALLAALLWRSARRAGVKTGIRSLRYSYALHSHLQHFPIFAGTLAYFRDVAQGRLRGVIEYQDNRR